jgi:3-phenylpropionate/trans-cinnamate dioxygenase ferredoxin reductase subunit
VLRALWAATPEPVAEVSVVSTRYLIVGGGMTADAACHGIREVDPGGPIVVVGAEPDPPYNRPPLSKALWKGESLDSIWRPPAPGPTRSCLGCTVTALDLEERTVTDDRGDTYVYEKLLLATGGTVRRLPFGDGIVYFRTVADYRSLRALAEEGRRFVVVGGGFIGSEIAAALAMNGKHVTMVFPELAVGARVYPADLARFLVDYFCEKGVEVLPGDTVTSARRADRHWALTTRSGRRLEADGVVAGIGIAPNTALAESAGLKVGDGIEVDGLLRTSAPDVYAAGDVASFHSPILGKRLRFEHEDNANTMGRLAGRNMAGAAEAYTHVPLFYSDLFDLGYEAVGEVDARLGTVADWKTPFREGVVYYMRDGRVRGVLLWNVWGQVDAARALLAEPGPFAPEDLAGRLGGPG